MLIMHGDDVLRVLDQSAKGMVTRMDGVHAAPRVAAAICRSGSPFGLGAIELVRDHEMQNLDSSFEARTTIKMQTFFMCSSFAASHEKSMNFCTENLSMREISFSFLLPG